MKTPAQKVIYSLLTLILLLSIGSGVVATNGNRTELINPELDNELSEETLKIIPIEDTLDYALYEQADKLSKSFINQNTKKPLMIIMEALTMTMEILCSCSRTHQKS